MNNSRQTLKKLEEMRLFGMQRSYQTLLESPATSGLTADEVVAHLADTEWDDRHDRRLNRLMTAARFRYSARFEELDFTGVRNLDKTLLLRLSDCRWIAQHQDIIVTGQTGVGKSFLATALGHQACLYGFKTLYCQCTKLFTHLKLCHADGSYLKEVAKIEHLDLVIFDDFGLLRLDGPSRLSLLEILEDRHGRKSTIFVSQVPVSQWHEIIGDPTLADAICDRIVHQAYRIELQGESLRKRQAPTP